MQSELKARIDRFRREYLDTPAGQQHLAAVESEPREVRRVVEEIRLKEERGEDITDDVLRRLLPHTASAFHRANGYRISTWPCVIKDVRPWFESVGWKQPSDWRPTASMLFAAVDGLVTGNLAPWEAFLASDYRRGFAAGFLSPILFCLDDRFAVVNSKVVKTYAYCTTQLGQQSYIDASLDSYLENSTRVKELQIKLIPYGLQTLREWDMFCHFHVSKELGGKPPIKPSPPIQFKCEVTQLCNELDAVQYNTSNPTQYEQVIAQAFHCLGLEVEHIGGPGKPDVIATGLIGTETFIVVIEAKTCGPDATIGLGIGFESINDHRSEYLASHAIVVAPGFSGGKLIDHAAKNKVGLLTTALLKELLQQNDECPFSISELSRLFSGYGLLDSVGSEFSRLHQARMTYLQLACDVLVELEKWQRRRVDSDPIPGDALYFTLHKQAASKGLAPLTKAQVEHALALLSNPVLQAIELHAGGYVLNMAPEAVAGRLQALRHLLIAST